MNKNLFIAILIMATGFCGYQWYRTATQYDDLFNEAKSLCEEVSGLAEANNRKAFGIYHYDRLIRTGPAGSNLPAGADTITSWRSFHLFLEEHDMSVFDIEWQ